MKREIFLLLLSGISYYFYTKKSMDSLIIICLFVLFLLMFKFDSESIKEHADGSIGPLPPNEALQSIASMYNSGTLKATNLEITGDIKVGGVADIKKGININGDVIQLVDENGNGTIKTKNRMHISVGELLYLLNKNGVIVGREWGGTGDIAIQGNTEIQGNTKVQGSTEVNGKLIALGDGGNLLKENKLYKIQGKNGELDNFYGRCGSGDKDRDVQLGCGGGHGGEFRQWKIVSA
jgi:hypothetical protein